MYSDDQMLLDKMPIWFQVCLLSLISVGEMIIEKRKLWCYFQIWRILKLWWYLKYFRNSIGLIYIHIESNSIDLLVSCDHVAVVIADCSNARTSHSDFIYLYGKLSVLVGKCNLKESGLSLPNNTPFHPVGCSHARVLKDKYRGKAHHLCLKYVQKLHFFMSWLYSCKYVGSRSGVLVW
jgi:hypothetical protein